MKQWFQTWVGGQLWTIGLVPDDDPQLKTDDGSSCNAITLAHQCLILLSEDLQGDALVGYLVHELFGHAVEDVSGSAFELSEHCETAEDYEQLEERMVRYRTPVILGLLRQFGVTFPLPPEPKP